MKLMFVGLSEIGVHSHHMNVVYGFSFTVFFSTSNYKLLVFESSLKLSSTKMTLNYLVIVERYPILNGVVGGSIPIVKSSLYLMEKH